MTPYRLVQWTTGNVARITVAQILRRPGLDLVGCYAWSPAKVGVDVAELCGLPEPTGVLATDDVDALLALRPDCVVYSPLRFVPEEVARILRAGVNVVTSAEFLSGHSFGDDARALLQEAGEAGGATVFGAGMNPGFAQLLAAVATCVCTEVRHVRATESVDVSLFAADGNMDDIGWGRPMDDPGHAEDVAAATRVFADGVHVLAEALAVELDAVEFRCEFAAAVRDLDLPGRPIAAGTVAGLDLRVVGVRGGRDVVELHQRWTMDRELDPPMPVAHGYRIEVDGSPQVTLELGLLPDKPLEDFSVDDMRDIGLTITGMPVLNAVPRVVAAAPGIVTLAGLPVPAAPVLG